MKARTAVLTGATIAIFQSAALWLIAAWPHRPSADSYANLCRWDCIWYYRIVADGYHSVIPPVADNADLSNVAFFPGYPLLVHAITGLTGLSIGVALVISAQLACAAFWTYLLVLLEKWRVGNRLKALCVIALLAHPASFFLVAGYSESLFFALFLGFIFWLGRHDLAGAALAAAHGSFMSATRIVGLPAASFPLLVRDGRPWAVRALLVWTAASGGLAFLLFCALRFGHWDLYFWTQRIGWHVESDPLALFKPMTYLAPFAHVRDAFHREPYAVSQLAVPLFAAEWLAVIALEWACARKRPPGQRIRAERVLFYAIAWLAFFISASGLSHIGMRSMLRHTLFSHVLVMLGAVWLASENAEAVTEQWRRRKGAAWIVAAAAISLALALALFQALLARDFVQARWVA